MTRTTDGDLKKVFRRHLPRVDFQAVEMDIQANGVPDINFCFDGVEGWIELKATKHWSVVVQPGQVAWIERRLRKGGRVFVAVRRQAAAGPRRGAKSDELWLLHGSAIRELATEGLASLDKRVILGQWNGGPRKWCWPEIEVVLTRVPF